ICCRISIGFLPYIYSEKRDSGSSHAAQSTAHTLPVSAHKTRHSAVIQNLINALHRYGEGFSKKPVVPVSSAHDNLGIIEPQLS
ncbi:MAG: hypothetical protein LHW52_06880, partial [Candidatus Cloacimonetes bacterium]|nr:hypothetical protein [Candidatus Cloacimonadota bacterium]